MFVRTVDTSGSMIKIGIIALLLVSGVMYFESSQSPKSTTLNPNSLPSFTLTPSPSASNNQTVVKDLKIEDIKVGSGSAEVKAGDTIVVNYKGTLLDGKQFDSSYDRGQPFEVKIGVGQVIKGWDEGLMGMRVGGKRRLTIPSDMAYGPQGAGPIPPNSPLIFEVELLAIK